MMRGRALTTRSTAQYRARWQGTGDESPGRHAAGGARQDDGPPGSVRRSAPPPHSRGGPVGAALTRCGGMQRRFTEQTRRSRGVQRHDRQLDRLDGEAHQAVSAPLRPPRMVGGVDSACVLRRWRGNSKHTAGVMIETVSDSAVLANPFLRSVALIPVLGYSLLGNHSWWFLLQIPEQSAPGLLWL